MQIVGYEPRRPRSNPPPADDDPAVDAEDGLDSSSRSPLSDATLLVSGPSGGKGESTGDAGEVTRISLEPGTRLEYGLETRRCAGTLTADGHQPCDRPAAPYCQYHTSTWVCARCTGTCLKDEMDCYEAHAIYLAAFGPDTFKVGVTRRWRLETRLREQGADRGAHIATVPDGRIAREREADLAATDGLVDRVRTRAKVRSLAESVDEAGWAALLERTDVDVRSQVAFEYGLDLETRPVRETLATGTVIGAKGRLLVLERGGTTYAVDMRDLVGYELEERGDGQRRQRQSSLGAFS